MLYIYNDEGVLRFRDEFVGEERVRRIRFFYDGSWRLRIVDHQEVADARITRTEIFAYDDKGRIETVTHRLGSPGSDALQVAYVYREGRVLFRDETPLQVRRNPQTRRYRYGYDERGRLISEEPDDGGPGTYYFYGAGSALLTKQHGDLISVYDNDEWGNVVAETVTLAEDISVTKAHWQYTFDCFRDPPEEPAPVTVRAYLSATTR